MTIYTLHDAVGSAVSCLVFALVLYGPGYSLAYATNLFHFKKLGVAHQSAWAVALSFATAPLLAYLTSKFIGLNAACVLLLCIGLPGLALGAQQALAEWRRKPRGGLAAFLLVLWCLFVLASLLDIQVGHRLYFSVVQFDQSYRVAFTDAVMRTGVPPANPLYFAGAAQPMRYYYFWYVLCACVAKLGHVSSRQAVTASSVWAGVGLGANAALYVRHFFGIVDARRRQVVLTIALLAVTGADLLPALGALLSQPAVNGEMEWWSVDQIASWQDTVLWVPHHTAALLCCLICFLLVWKLTYAATVRRHHWPVIALGGIAFASGFGLSIYVAAGFALLMFALACRSVLSAGAGRALARNLLLVAVAAAVACAPFLYELIALHSTTGAGEGAGAGHVLAFGIRAIIDPELLTGLPAFGSWHRAHPVLLDNVFRLLLLLPGLALELGVYGAALWLWFRDRRKLALEDPRRVALFLAIAGLVMVTFLRSAVIGNNDFGYRAALLPQFFLLLLTGDLLHSWRTRANDAVVPSTPLRRRFFIALLVLGFAGTVFQAAMLRLFLPIEARRPASGFARLPGEAFDARASLTALNHVASSHAVIAFNPVDPSVETNGDVVTPFTFYTRALMLDAGRQILSAEPRCATHFGGVLAPCDAIEHATARLYALPAPRAEWALDYCAQLHVQYLVASELDPAWRDLRGWVWNMPVIASQPSIRVMQCAADPR